MPSIKFVAILTELYRLLWGNKSYINYNQYKEYHHMSSRILYTEYIHHCQEKSNHGRGNSLSTRYKNLF